MFLKLNGVCTFCQHPKCNDCREEYTQERNDKVYLLNPKEMAHNEALRKREMNQLPIGPTLRAASASSSAEYTNKGQTPFHTFTEGIPGRSESGDGLDKVLSPGEHTPYSGVEPQGIDPNVTLSFGNAPSGDQNVNSGCFNGEWGPAYSNDWGPRGLNVGNTEPELFVTNRTDVEPQTLAYSTFVGTNDWTSTSGYTPYTFPDALQSFTDRNGASFPSAAYSSPCGYHGPQQDLSKELSPHGAYPPLCPSKDITACNSCLSDSTVLEKPLACVFYKYNPEQYSSCMQKRFKDIGHLAQHLKKHHRGKIPRIPKAHQKNSNWKWYWVWNKLFERHPPPKCPYAHPDQDMKAHNLHQFFRGLREPLNAGVNIGSVIQSIVRGLSSSPEPSSYGQFMDTLRTSSLAQHSYDSSGYPSSHLRSYLGQLWGEENLTAELPIPWKEY
ncbi:hypothetical protein GGR53DRAFT_331113 [Hypoxylon sp. FL1150]|nr:hypothetical protein GGR53DRAFT_331113 [Hypoxylon sp. FL1150]